MLPFCCKFCKNGFKREKSKQKHQIKCPKNPKNKKGFKCELCAEKGKTKFLSNYDSWTAHKKNIHGGPRVFKCKDCGVSHKYEWYAKKHKKTCKGKNFNLKRSSQFRK